MPDRKNMLDTSHEVAQYKTVKELGTIKQEQGHWVIWNGRNWEWLPVERLSLALLGNDTPMVLH